MLCLTFRFIPWEKINAKLLLFFFLFLNVSANVVIVMFLSCMKWYFMQTSYLLFLCIERWYFILLFTGQIYRFSSETESHGPVTSFKCNAAASKEALSWEGKYSFLLILILLFVWKCEPSQDSLFLQHWDDFTICVAQL